MIDPIGLRLIHSALLENKIYLLNDTIYQWSEVFRNVIDFCLNYKIEYSEYPKTYTVEEKFGLSFSNKIEPFEFISDLYLERQAFQNAENLIKEQVSDFENRDLKSLVQKAEIFVKNYNKKQTKQCISYKDNAELRFEEYLRLKRGEIEDGIDTPWPSLNKQIKKWVNGTINIILGNSEVGKSWSLGIMANYASINKHKSLFVSREMSKFRIEKRLDVLKFKIPFKDLRDAELDFISEERYKNELITYRNSDEEDIIIAGKQEVRTIDDVIRFVSIYEPKIVLIDGGYLLKSKQANKSNWENQENIVKELQEAAEVTNIPWIISSQLWDDDSKVTSKFARRDKVKYGKEWIIGADVCLSLRQNEDMKHMNVMEIEPLKLRDAYKEAEKIIINWNTNTMDYTEVVNVKQPVSNLGDIVPDNEIKF